jgi:hypothetical protein
MPSSNTPHRRERPDLARDLLAVIARRGDLIAEAPDGRVFVLLEMDRPTFERLCVTDAEREDLEDEPDDDAQDEPSAAELHPMDRPAPIRRRSAA